MNDFIEQVYKALFLHGADSAYLSSVNSTEEIGLDVATEMLKELNNGKAIDIAEKEKLSERRIIETQPSRNC